MTDKQKPFGETIRELRERKGLLLRQVAAKLEVDTAFLSKIERNVKRANRLQVDKIAEVLDANAEELITLWLSDRILDSLEKEGFAINALKLTERRLTQD